MKLGDKERIIESLTLFIEKEAEISFFCSDIESFINFELEFEALTSEEKTLMEDLFTCVTWFNPYKNERQDYSGFNSPEKIKEKAKHVLSRLK